MKLSDMALPLGVDFSFLEEYAREINNLNCGVLSGEAIYIITLAKYIYELECRICDLEAKLDRLEE